MRRSCGNSGAGREWTCRHAALHPQASRDDWYALRGEYLTQYLRELKEQLRGEGKKLGIFVNPQQPHFTQPWPELMLTAGHIYCDLETWVRQRIVDQLVVYGSCQPTAQNRAIDDCLWLTRATPCQVSPLVQDPSDACWNGYRKQGVWIVMSIGEEQSYLSAARSPNNRSPRRKTTIHCCGCGCGADHLWPDQGHGCPGGAADR